MPDEYTQKVLAFWLLAVTLLSIAFASTEDQAVANKIEIPVEISKPQLIEAAVGEPLDDVATVVIEVPVVDTNEALVVDTTVGVDSAQWATNVEVTVTSDEFRFESDGLPGHELPSVFVAQQRGYAPPAGPDQSSIDVLASLVEFPIDETITLNPVFADEPTESPAGLIGVLVNGTQVFKDEEISIPDELVSLEWGYVDICNGHPNVLPGDGLGGYHYHAVPSCATDAIDLEGQHSSVVGFLIDGFPVYGSNDEDGAAIRRRELDDCNGHFGPTPEFPNGIYHYHFLDDVSVDPFPCLHGELGSDRGVEDFPVAARTRFGE